MNSVASSETDVDRLLISFQMAIDTIFLCFCEDCEENDGVVKPYYMSKGLMVIIPVNVSLVEALYSEALFERNCRRSRRIVL